MNAPNLKSYLLLAAALVSPQIVFSAPDHGLKAGNAEFKSIGSLAFGPGDILFAADPKGAAIFAIDTSKLGKLEAKGKLEVKDIDKKLAGLLGTTPDKIVIEDLAVNAKGDRAFISVSRGLGPDAAPVLFSLSGDDAAELVAFEKLSFAKTSLSDAPEDKEIVQRRRKKNLRMESITDLAWVDGKLAVAGLSNEEFASTLRIVPFPFDGSAAASSIEIYHGAHGKEETHSPIRTFMPMTVAGEPNIIASYTCTPLVSIPVASLKPKTLVKGRTIAELGNRNRPLDMIEYDKEGKRYILMANSSRGVMKVSTENIDKVEAITERVERGATKGLPYETIGDWKDVVQLARLGEKNALVIRKVGESGHVLEQLALP